MELKNIKLRKASETQNDNSCSNILGGPSYEYVVMDI